MRSHAERGCRERSNAARVQRPGTDRRSAVNKVHGTRRHSAAAGGHGSGERNRLVVSRGIGPRSDRDGGAVYDLQGGGIAEGLKVALIVNLVANTLVLNGQTTVIPYAWLHLLRDGHRSCPCLIENGSGTQAQAAPHEVHSIRTDPAHAHRRFFFF